jgi:hypothetical protein
MQLSSRSVEAISDPHMPNAAPRELKPEGIIIPGQDATQRDLFALEGAAERSSPE